MKLQVTACLLAASLMLTAVPTASAASGDTSVPTKPETVNITDSYFAERVSGNCFMYIKSPQARIGKEVVLIDENNKSLTPQMIGSSLMVPAAFLAKALGAEYEGGADKAALQLQDTKIALEADKAVMTVNGTQKELTAAPQTVEGSLYVPLRAVCEALGKQVAWDASGITIFGDTANSFSWNDRTDFQVLLRATRDVLYEKPDPASLIEKLREENPNGQHPRLLLNTDKIEVLRQRVMHEEPYKSWFAEEKRKADVYLTYNDAELNVNYVLEDGLRLLYVSRRAQTYITTLSFCYLMTGNEAYAKKAIYVMMKVCGDDFPDWHPYHFLDVAEMAAGVALGYDWCYDLLRPSQKYKIKNALLTKALKPVMEDYNELPGRSRTWYWSSKSSEAYVQNWVAVCFGGTTLAALAIGDEDLGDFTEAGNVITEGMERVRDLYETYMPDGAFLDGTSYWELAMEYMALGIEGMETALGSSYTMLNSPGIDKTFDWLAQVMGSAGAFNYDSNNSSFTNSPEYFWYAQRMNRPELATYRLQQHIGKWHMSTDWRDIIWYEPPGDSDSTVHMNLSYSSRGGTEMSVLRSGFDDMDSWMAIYGGELDHESSSVVHLTGGSFVLDMLGERWAEDLGAEQGSYGTTGTPRIHYYRCRAEGHNTVIVAPGAGFDHNPYACGKEVQHGENESSSYVIYDFTEELAFKGVTDWKRGILMDYDTKRVLVQDEMSMSKKTEYYWFMHTKADIEVSEDGRSAVLTQNNKQVLARLISSDKNLSFSVMDAAPLPTSPNPSHQQVNEGVRKLTVHAEAVDRVNMSVELIPLYGAETVSAETSYTPLAKWKPVSGSLDASLTVSNVTVDGVPLEGFTPEQKYYGIELGLSGILSPPDIAAESSEGTVTIIPPTTENYAGKIIVQDPNDAGRRNEYLINFYKTDFTRALTSFATTKLYALGDTSGLTEIKPESVEAEYVPQPENPPMGMFDGDYSTRYSTHGLNKPVTIDFGTETTITHIGTAVYGGKNRGMMYVMAKSDDGVKWDEVISVKTNGGSDKMEIYQIPEIKTRYVRLYPCGNTNDGSNENAWWSITEMAFFAKK